MEERQKGNIVGGSILKFMKPNTSSKPKEESINASSSYETTMLENMNSTNNDTVNIPEYNQDNTVQNTTENNAEDIEGRFSKSFSVNQGWGKICYKLFYALICHSNSN